MLQQLKLVVNAGAKAARAEFYREEAIAAAIAILASEAQDWLRANPEAQQYCLEHLALQTEAQPEQNAWNSSESVSDGCDTFAGLASLHFILSGRTEEWLWRGVFER